MPPRSTTLAACLAVLALGPASAPGAVAPGLAGPTVTAPVRDDVEALDAWLDEFGLGRNALAESTRDTYLRLLGKVGKDASGRGKNCVEARLMLLRAAGWGLEGTHTPEVARWIRERAQAELADRLAPGRGKAILDWVLYELLAFPDRHDALLRAVALRALEQRLESREVEPHLLVAIMAAGRDRDGFVRLTVADILKGRPEAFVSDYFLGALERREVRPELFDEHLGSLPPADIETWLETKDQRLFDYVRLRLESKDWREASRALALAHRFELSRIVPPLITGLGVWSRRDTGGARRVRHEFRSALKQITGRDHGEDPTSWARWWQSAIEGGTIPEPELEERTTATFYGLRPSSDRILFLIDRSGSMRERLEGQSTRFEDAVERLLYTLRDLGEDTRFGVVLFNARGHAFREGLTQATEDNLEQLKRWAGRIQPDGGTSLFAGLDTALPGLTAGTSLSGKVAYDTVIVLCDGETESATWVAPWLAQHNLDARLVFHCVNIGGKPGGVLEALSGGSGGSFVSIETD